MVEDLCLWKEKILEVLPNVDLSPIEENLYRVSDPALLYKSLRIKEKKIV